MNTNSKIHNIHIFPLLLLAMLVNILAQAVYKTGHHMVYQVMGHEPIWAFTKVVQMSVLPINLNTWVEITNPDGSSNWLKVSSMPTGETEKVIMAAADPLLGLFSAILGLVMAHRSVKATAKQVWVAYAISISLVAVLYYLRAPIRTGGDEYDIAVNLLGSVATGLPMVLLDPIIIAQVDTDNPWFQPIIGYSLPVFITIILTFIGVWAWARWQESTAK